MGETSMFLHQHSVINVKVLVGAFNQEKALAGAFSVIVQLHRLIDLRHYPVQFSSACPSDGLIPVLLLLSSLMMNQEDWNCTLKKSFAQWAKFTRSLFQFCNVYEELNIEQKVQNHHCYANILLILVWVNNSWVLLIWSNVKSIYLI